MIASWLCPLCGGKTHVGLPILTAVRAPVQTATGTSIPSVEFNQVWLNQCVTCSVVFGSLDKFNADSVDPKAVTLALAHRELE